MNRYELVLIFKDSQNIEEPLKKLKDFLIKNSVQLIDETLWGKRKLAYPIKSQSKGYYVILLLNTAPSIIEEINKKLLMNEDILRHLFIKISKMEASNNNE